MDIFNETKEILAKLNDPLDKILRNVRRLFRNSMPNRTFIINRLSGMAYEGLSGSSAAAGRRER